MHAHVTDLLPHLQKRTKNDTFGRPHIQLIKDHEVRKTKVG
jgi:hypothetical protein